MMRRGAGISTEDYRHWIKTGEMSGTGKYLPSSFLSLISFFEKLYKKSLIAISCGLFEAGEARVSGGGVSERDRLAEVISP